MQKFLSVLLAVLIFCVPAILKFISKDRFPSFSKNRDLTMFRQMNYVFFCSVPNISSNLTDDFFSYLEELYLKYRKYFFSRKTKKKKCPYNSYLFRLHYDRFCTRSPLFNCRLFFFLSLVHYSQSNYPYSNCYWYIFKSSFDSVLSRYTFTRDWEYFWWKCYESGVNDSFYAPYLFSDCCDKSCAAADLRYLVVEKKEAFDYWFSHFPDRSISIPDAVITSCNKIIESLKDKDDRESINELKNARAVLSFASSLVSSEHPERQYTLQQSP